MLKPGRIAIIIGLIGLLLLGVVLTFGLADPLPSPKELAIWIRSFGMWAPVVVIALMIIHSFVPFPAELLAVCAGAVFGVLQGSLLIWFGAMLGAVLAFAISRRLGRSLVRYYLSEAQFAALDRWTEKQGTLALLISRFIPMIAFNLINYAAGLTRVSLWTFLWTTGVGILPVTVLSVYLGAQMRELSWTLLGALSLACVTVVWLLHRLAKARRWI
jgi:uncharacterized membrane protein YdjX (TVP38/TMEM64 family)